MRVRTFPISIVLLTAIALSAQAADTAETVALQQTVYLSLLLDENPEKARLGVRSIDQLDEGADKIALCDTVAERLIALATPNPAVPAMLADSLAWHAITLGNTGDGRYREVLQRARGVYTEKKIVAKLDAALVAAAGSTKEQYLIRGFDPGLRAQVEQKLAAAKKSDRSAFARTQVGTRLPDVLQALGAPDDLSIVTVTVSAYGRNSMLAAHYAGAGMVMFTVRREWVAQELVDELFSVQEHYRGKYFGTAQALASMRGMAFSEFMRRTDTKRLREPEMAEVLAQRLIVASQPADKYEQKQMVACVKVISQLGNARAVELLQKIAKSPGVPAVQKDANAYARKLQARLASGAPPEPEEEPEEEPESKEATESADDAR